ncbi:MAG: DNA alkylation repair protein [Paludibacter sp.]|nr:DNA alkylation repair protein [Paludibacter sp.]
MKYYISNPELDKQIAEIRVKVRLSMNGIVSEKMAQNGINYKKNYGVSIPRIREIAKLYPQNHDLAQRLWNLQTRETMILATLLEPIDKFTFQHAQEWVDSFNQIEIVEQACMNLFSKLPYATNLCTNWIHQDKKWRQITGFILAARVYEKLDQDEINDIIKVALTVSENAEFHLYKAIALCLSRFCRVNKNIAQYILNEIKAFKQTPTAGQKLILDEVTQEILFLNIL